MALTMPAFVDTCGNSYPASHWRVVQLNIGAAAGVIAVTYYAFRDAASFAAGKAPLPGGVKSYAISGADFATVGGQAPGGATLFAALEAASDSYALAKLDTPTGQLDSSGKPVLASFFAGATQIP